MRITTQKAYLRLIDALQAKGALSVKITIDAETEAVTGIEAVMRPPPPALQPAPGRRIPDLPTDIESGEKTKPVRRPPPGLGHLE